MAADFQQSLKHLLARWRVQLTNPVGKMSLDDVIHPNEFPAIDTILASHAFERTPTLKRLLVFLWEHRGKDFSEYSIATEGLGRRPDFDPRTDATVRVEVSRLRLRLKYFYETEGVTTLVRVRIPKGSHNLEVFRTEATTSADGAPNAAARLSPGMWLRLMFLATCCCITLLAVKYHLETKKASANGTLSTTQVAPLPHFWQEFLANGKPSLIMLSTPTFFYWESGPISRDPDVNDFLEWRKSPSLVKIAREFGPPTLMETYTVAEDTRGSLRLASFLEMHNLPVSVAITKDVPDDTLERENIIVMATWSTLRAFERRLGELGASSDFYMKPGGECVENRRPQKGEPEQFCYQAESATRSICPAVLALLPGRGRDTRVVLLNSWYTMALANFITSRTELDQLDAMWKARGYPRYFTAVVDLEMSGNQCLRSWPVALHSAVGSR
jgi:hypothetical protein